MKNLWKQLVSWVKNKLSWAKEAASNFAYGIGTKNAQNKMINTYASWAVEKDVKNWKPEDRSLNKIISAKTKLYKETKTKLKNKVKWVY